MHHPSPAALPLLPRCYPAAPEPADLSDLHLNVILGKGASGVRGMLATTPVAVRGVRLCISVWIMGCWDVCYSASGWYCGACWPPLTPVAVRGVGLCNNGCRVLCGIAVVVLRGMMLRGMQNSCIHPQPGGPP